MKLLIVFYRYYFNLLAFFSSGYAAEKAFNLFCTPLNKKIRPRERKITSAENQVNLTVTKPMVIQYRWGKGKRTALLIHGWEGNAGNFGAIIDLLLAHNFTIYAIDAPAHGQSKGKRTTLPVYAGVLEQFLKAIPEPDLVLTHSFGGPAFVYHLFHSSRTYSGTLIMLTVPDNLDTAFRQFFHFFAIPVDVQKKVYALLEQRYNYSPGKLATSALAGKIQWGKTIIIHDQNDAVLPISNSEAVATAIPGSKLIKVQGKGHYRLLWDKEVTAILAKEIAG